jgi:pyrroloquinoline-quinone synthase
MDIQRRMIWHPFYQAWSRGEVTRAGLGTYHRSYGELVRRVPSAWINVVNAFQPDLAAPPAVIQEERDHILLWELWGRAFPSPEEFPSLYYLIDELEQMDPSVLLGALQSYEMQQPEVSRAKSEGLKRYYGSRDEELRYFAVHEQEEPHIAYGQWLAENFAEKKKFDEGFHRGAELVYHALDHFVGS